MTIKVKPIHSCAKHGCDAAATRQITFETRRGSLKWGQVCDRHVQWGTERAREVERS